MSVKLPPLSRPHSSPTLDTIKPFDFHPEILTTHELRRRRASHLLEHGLVTIARDVSFQQNMAREYCLSFSDMYQLLSTTAMKVFWTDRRAKICFWSEAMVKSTGISKDQVEGKSLVNDLTHSSYEVEVLMALQSIAEGNCVSKCNICFDITSSHPLKRFVLNLFPRRDPVSHSFSGSLCIAEEIPDSQYEERFMRNGSGEDFIRLVEDLDARIIGCDCNCTINIWNKSAAYLTGWSKGEALGSPLNKLICLHDKGIRVAIMDALRGKESDAIGVDIINAHDNSVYTVMMSVSSQMSGGEIVGALCVIDDNEAERKCNSLYKQSLAALEETTRDLERMEATIVEKQQREYDAQLSRLMQKTFRSRHFPRNQEPFECGICRVAASPG